MHASIHRQADRQADRQPGRHTYIHTCVHMYRYVSPQYHMGSCWVPQNFQCLQEKRRSKRASTKIQKPVWAWPTQKDVTWAAK